MSRETELLQNGLVYNPYFIWLFRRQFEGARVNEWVSEYVIRWPICFSAVWNVLKDLVGSGIVWFGLDRRLLSQAIRISFFILYVYKCYPLLLYVFCLLV